MLPDLHTGFSGGRSGGLVFLIKKFPEFVVVHTFKVFGVIKKAEVDISLELSCFFYDPPDVGNLICCPSVFSKPSFHLWKFSVHVLLKTSVRDFELYLASM